MDDGKRPKRGSLDSCHKPPTHIHYIELGSPEAQQTLRAVLESLRLCPGFVDAALLHSAGQDLWLLESRWQGTPAVPGVPAGAKAWAFVVAAFTFSSRGSLQEGSLQAE